MDRHIVLRRLRAHFISEGYLYDWLLALALIIFNFTVPCILIPPVQRTYIPGDPALSYPSQHVPLSEAQKYALVFLLPGAISCVAQLWYRSWLDWHHLMLAVLEGFAIQSTFKKWMNLTGRLRPDWFSRLAKSDEELIAEGRVSYPSGHASETFACFGIATLYLMSKLKVFVHAGPGHLGKAVLCLIPLMLATLITCSRVVGYRHDFSDINAGMAIGLCSAALGYSLNYPSLFAPNCDLPRQRAHKRSATALDELTQPMV